MTPAASYISVQLHQRSITTAPTLYNLSMAIANQITVKVQCMTSSLPLEVLLAVVILQGLAGDVEPLRAEVGPGQADVLVALRLRVHPRHPPAPAPRVQGLLGRGVAAVLAPVHHGQQHGAHRHEDHQLEPEVQNRLQYLATISRSAFLKNKVNCDNISILV